MAQSVISEQNENKLLQRKLLLQSKTATIYELMIPPPKVDEFSLLKLFLSFYDANWSDNVSLNGLTVIISLQKLPNEMQCYRQKYVIPKKL